MYTHSSIHLGLWLPVIILVTLLLLAFEIWMIIDATLNHKIGDQSKAFWIIGMLLIHPFVGIAYYFTDHKKR